MPSPTYDSTGIQYYDIPSFTFISGTTIPIKVAYRSYNPSSPKAVCIPTCYGGRINTTLTFTENNGALSSHHVVVVAMLGNGESSSPSNTPDFPKTLDYRDCIHAQYELLTKHLGVRELDAVVGFSMAGQQAYYWASMYPTYVHNAVVICGSARTSGHNYAFIEGPKAALLNSIDYADYKANSDTQPLRGLRAFGRVYCAWLTSGAWFRERQWEKALGYGSVEEYIAATMEKSFEDWHPEDVLILARMWQAGDVGVTRDDGSYEEALRAIQARVLVMPGQTDQYFAVEDSEVEVGLLGKGKGQLAVIESVWGHAAGGGMSEGDAKWMGGRIGEFLK